MSQKDPAGVERSVPQVCDQIAEAARNVRARGETTATAGNDGPIIVEQACADGSMTVTMEDGRLTNLLFDEATARRRASTVSEDLMELINGALAAHEQAVLAELEASPDEFGTLLTSLGDLQSALHDAYAHDLRRLDS